MLCGGVLGRIFGDGGLLPSTPGEVCESNDWLEEDVLLSYDGEEKIGPLGELDKYRDCSTGRLTPGVIIIPACLSASLFSRRAFAVLTALAIRLPLLSLESCTSSAIELRNASSSSFAIWIFLLADSANLWRSPWGFPGV